MRRSLLASVIALVLAQAASANPLTRTWHFMGHHKRFFIMEGFAIGAAGIHAYGLNHCRSTGSVERCESSYGSAWASWGVISGMNVIVMPALAESCWKGQGGKFCYVMGYGGSAGQLGFGIAQWRKSPESHHTEAPDLLKLRF